MGEGLDSAASGAPDGTINLDRLDDFRQMCDAPADVYSAGDWCEAANVLLAIFDATETRYINCCKALDDLISLDKGLERIAASEETGCVDMRVTIDAHTAAVNAVELALWEPK